jgi:hypothetical protein
VSTESLDARDDLRELARLYEEVGSLEGVLASSGGSGVGPRIPPGARLLLNADEVSSARADLDDWARFCGSIVASDVAEEMPDLTPALLRWLGERVDVMLEQDDEYLTAGFVLELTRHLATFRRLAHRGERVVDTGESCRVPGCTGRLVSGLGGLSGTDDALRCDRCGEEVPFLVWQHWPRVRVPKFVTPEHAARLLGTTVNAVRIRAHRDKWRRIGTGRDVRYLIDDVRRADA